MNPKPSYAYYCTVQFSYNPTVVIATVENQNTNCEDYQTTTKFNTNFTIKGSSPNQFEIKTVYNSTWGLCKKYPYQSNDEIAKESDSDPKFEISKKYILAIFPDNNSTKASLAVCERTAFEVSGLLDPKVILTTIGIYTRPLWIGPFILTIYLTLTLNILLAKFIPNLPALILSGFIVLILDGFLLYILFRIIRYIIRKIRKT